MAKILYYVTHVNIPWDAVVTRSIFFQILQNIYPRARTCWQNIGRLFRVQSLIDVLLLPMQYCMKYHDILDRVITAPECIDENDFQ